MSIAKYSNLIVGGIIFLVVIFAVILGPVFASYNPVKPNWSNVNLGPSWSHPFGTDEYGRDVMTRVLHGGRISLFVALIAQALNTVIGVTLGLIGGYFGGTTDDFVMGLVNVLLALPPLILGVSILVILGPGLLNVIIAIGITYWTYTCRISRSNVLSIREKDYVEGAEAMGASSVRILWHHILPNTMGPILVIASLGLADTILLQATFGFLGLGVQPPTPEWGTMLSNARGYLYSAPWVTIAPGMAIFATVLSVNLLGDGLRDIFDPHIRES